MADPTQYSFSFAEVMQLLLKSANVHEGRWVIGIEFNVLVGPMGVKPDEAYPGAMIAANKIIISAAGDAPTPPNLTFDATELNPASKSKK